MSGVAPRAGLDVYLFPAVVGGGIGDIEEVLLAGRVLSRLPGVRLKVFRRPGRPLPPNVDGPWDWPRHERVERPAPDADRALTISAEWGVSAAPERPEPYGRGGPWSIESAAVEQAYGVGSVVHVSLEEFARTLTSRRESFERLREGGMPIREIRAGLDSRRGRREIAEFHRAYRKFRAFDRPNLLTVFATFRPSRAFALEYPEAIQTGPLWPGSARAPGRRAPPRRPRWVWYASPSTSPRLVPEIDRAVEGVRAPPMITVRSPRDWPTRLDRRRWRLVGAMSPGRWRNLLGSADLRIVTGSRTLLEALELGGPFLYFNGLVGAGRARRRHRPEKILGLLGAWRAEGVGGPVRRALSEFSAGRHVAAVVRRAADTARFARGFPDRWRPIGFPPPFDDASTYLRHVATRWSTSAETSPRFVADRRAEGRRALHRGAPRSEV